MSAKYQGCPRWRTKIHIIIHWAKEHIYWCKNFKIKQEHE